MMNAPYDLSKITTNHQSFLMGKAVATSLNVSVLSTSVSPAD